MEGKQDEVKTQALVKRFIIRLVELAGQGRFGKIRTFNPSYQKLLAILSRLLENPSYPITLWGESGTGKKTLIKEMISFSQLITRLEGCEVKVPQFFDCRLVASGFTRDLRIDSGEIVVFEGVEHLSKDLQKELLDFLNQRSQKLLASMQNVGRVFLYTSESLSFKVLKKGFLRDLFVALNPTLLCVPTLNERSEDFPILFKEILMELTQNGGQTVDSSLIDHLELQIWGRNVAQLRKEIQTRVHRMPNINRWTLQVWNSTFENQSPPRAQFKHLETKDVSNALAKRQKLQFALHRAGGDREKAARLLGLNKGEFLRALFTEGLR
jgi:DNA-binding NtrC family response regulator